ncbi:MAG: hemolysin family protein [Verrucomicrobiota bacterium]
MSLLFYLILTCVLSVAISAFCSLAEASLLSLSPVRLEALKREGKRYASIWLKLKDELDKSISAVLILNTISNTGGATLAGFLFDQVFGSDWLWVFMILLTLSILFFAELGPKVLGAVYCEKLAPTLGPILYSIVNILQPLVIITEKFSRRFKGDGDNTKLSALDIEVMAQLARNKKVIALEQEKMIISATKFSMTAINEVMLPAEWIVFLNLKDTVANNLELARHALHSRYPVSSSDNIQDVNGYINYKDLVAIEPDANYDLISLEAFIRPILALEDELDLNTAFKRLTARRHHIALVRNKKKRVVGLVTLEDIIEELVGEIEDEFDQSNDIIIRIRPNFWRVGADLSIERLEKILQLSIDVPPSAKELTLANWLKAKIGDTRYPGVTYEQDGIKFVVQQARRGRIFQVLVEVRQPTTQSQGGWEMD